MSEPKGRCVECDKELFYQAGYCPRCNYYLDAGGLRVRFAGKDEPQAEDLVEDAPPEVVIA